MARRAPEFSLTAGSFRCTTEAAAGGPSRIVLERDMSAGGESLEIELMDRSGMAIGDPVTLELGFDGSRELVFTGEIAVAQPGLSGVRVIALGRMNALMQLRAAAFYERRTAGDIVKDLAGRAGVDIGTVEDGPELPRYAVDRRLTGHAHCRELADRLGFELYTNREGKLMFRGLGAASSLDAGPLGAVSSALGLGGGERYEYGKHLLAAQARRALPAVERVEVGGESPMSAEGDTAAHWLTPEGDDYRGEAGAGDSPRLVVDMAARTKDLATRFAQGYRITARRPSIAVNACILGRPSLDLGDSISIAGAGDDLINGACYIQAIRHHLSREGGYRTEVRLIPESEP